MHSTTLAALWLIVTCEPPWLIGKADGQAQALQVRYGERQKSSLPIAQAESPAARPPETGRTVTDVSEVTGNELSGLAEAG